MFCYSTSAYVLFVFFFFFNDTATTEIYTLSLHDALPISFGASIVVGGFLYVFFRTNLGTAMQAAGDNPQMIRALDRKSTRLNSSHANISYAVFCLKKKKKHKENIVQNIN